MFMTLWIGSCVTFFFQALKMCELKQLAMQVIFRKSKDITGIGCYSKKKEFCYIQFVVYESSWVFTCCYLVMLCQFNENTIDKG